MVPSVAECFQRMDQYGMLDHIRAHSCMVARVAGLIGNHLIRAGQEVSIPVLVAGALLHDIAKTASLHDETRHDRVGRDICLRHGYEEIADIVAEHVILQNGVPHDCCREKEIVYYADKRVRHDQVVSLDERLDYLLERYGKGDARLQGKIRENFLMAREIEEKIFAALAIHPGEVRELVSAQPLVCDGQHV